MAEPNEQRLFKSRRAARPRVDVEVVVPARDRSESVTVPRVTQRKLRMTTTLEVDQPRLPRQQRNRPKPLDGRHELQRELLIGAVAPRGVRLDDREGRIESLLQRHDAVEHARDVPVICAQEHHSGASEAVDPVPVWRSPRHSGAASRARHAVTYTMLDRPRHRAEPA
jgi:hypothetical protein